MKIKVCPVCGAVNAVREQDCTKCGASLIETAVTDDAEPAADAGPETTESVSEAKEPARGPAAFRICPQCGSSVRPNTWKCDRCGTALYGLPLVTEDHLCTEKPEETERPAYLLRSEDGRISIRVREGETVTVGREAAGAEYLAGKLFVGRKHISVQAVDGWIYLTDLHSTNGSLVNGRAVKADTPCKLTENDLISLGAKEKQGPTENAAYFRLSKAVNEA